MNNSMSQSQRASSPRTMLLLGLIATGLLGFLLGSSSSTVEPASPETAQIAATPLSHDQLLWLLVGVTLIGVWRVYGRGRTTQGGDALRDAETGLYTAAYVEQVLPGMIARHDRAQSSQLALVRVELDPLGEVRSHYGSSAASQVLAGVGRHIRSQTREGDLPAQPDERGFSVYLHCLETDQARAFCRRLITLMDNDQFYWRGDVIKVTASIGVAHRQIGESLVSLRQRAESGAQRAREQGPNRIAD